MRVPVEALAPLLGAPVVLETLKHKPGRRWTGRARGSRATAIVKVYASDRAPTVAARVGALHPGPPAVTVPEVLHVAADDHSVVLSDVAGTALRHALVGDDRDACDAAGRALGTFHRWWSGTHPAPLGAHTPARELDALARWRPSPAVLAEARELAAAWPCSTVVHRDLYEDQVLVDGEGGVGLIDLDDAALGPPELDLGNLLAHTDLLGRRERRSLAGAVEAVRAGYEATGPALDEDRLDRCRRLTELRLACIHPDAAG